MLEIKNISIWYTKEKLVIDHANVDIEEHSVVGLIGINGAGKTTLINTISGVHTKCEVDKISFRNSEISLVDEEFKKNRYTVFTEEEAFGYWTFIEYKRYIEKVYQKKIDNDYLEFLINGFNFNEYINQNIKSLSTGNKKKVFLIVGFALKLPLLILDEPFDSLDYGASEFVYKVIKEHKKYGSVVMSSHIVESIEKTCDKIMLLSNGQIVSKEVTLGMDIRREIKECLNDCDKDVS